MTLIVSALNKNYSCQLSDRKLTKIKSNGTFEDYTDKANKAIVVVLKDAFFSVSYTGVGEINNVRTDDWFIEKMIKIKPWDKEIKEFFNEFNKESTAWLSQVERITGKEWNHSFVFVGMYAGNIPTLFLSSNFEGIKTGRRYINKQADFHSHYVKLKLEKNNSSCVLLSGNNKTVKEDDFKDLSNIIQNPNVSCVNFINKAVKSMVNAATRSSNIGKDIMSVTLMPNNPEAECAYHPYNKSEINFMPNIVSPGVLMKGIEVYTGGGLPPWRR